MSEKKPSRLPIVLTAFVYPGCGQAAQGRWPAALLLGGLFGLALAFFLVEVAKLLYVYYTLAATFREPGQIAAPGAGRMLIAAAACLAVYSVGVVDAYRAYRRACGQWAARRHGLAQAEDTAAHRPPPVA